MFYVEAVPEITMVHKIWIFCSCCCSREHSRGKVLTQLPSSQEVVLWWTLSLMIWFWIYCKCSSCQMDNADLVGPSLLLLKTSSLKLHWNCSWYEWSLSTARGDDHVGYQSTWWRKTTLTDQLMHQAEKSWHHLSSYLQSLHYTLSIVMVMIKLEERSVLKHQDILCLFRCRSLKCRW